MNATIREAIRQERETFDQLQKQDRHWFTLRLVMGYLAIALLLLVFVVCCAIMFNPSRFPAAVVTLASTGFLADVVGLVISVWKFVFTKSSKERLRPVTRPQISSQE